MTRPQGRPRTPRPKIVVIDDAFEILDLIEAVLSEEGFEVVVCQAAAVARETVAAERPDLVIADLLMSGAVGVSCGS